MDASRGKPPQSASQRDRSDGVAPAAKQLRLCVPDDVLDLNQDDPSAYNSAHLRTGGYPALQQHYAPVQGSPGGTNVATYPVAGSLQPANFHYAMDQHGNAFAGEGPSHTPAYLPYHGHGQAHQLPAHYPVFGAWSGDLNGPAHVRQQHVNLERFNVGQIPGHMPANEHLFYPVQSGRPIRPLISTPVRYKWSALNDPYGKHALTKFLDIQIYVEEGLFQDGGNHHVLRAFKGLAQGHQILKATDKELQVVTDIIRQRDTGAEYVWRRAHPDDVDPRSGSGPDIKQLRGAFKDAARDGRLHRKGKATETTVINDHLVLFKAVRLQGQGAREAERAWYGVALPLIRDGRGDVLEYDTRYTGGDVYLLGLLLEVQAAWNGAAPSHSLA